MYIQFTYTIPEEIARLARSTIGGFSNSNLIGWLSSTDAKKMHHCSMFLMCDLDNDPNAKIDYYTNASIMVAQNETDAVSMYNIITGHMNGTAICEIHHNCKDIKVKPTGVTMESDTPVRRNFPV